MNDSTGGTTLNVEEKKTRDRPSYGGGNRIGLDGGLRPPRDGNTPRRGPGAAARGGPVGIGTSSARLNNFNRPPPSRTSNTFNNRR